MSLGVLVTSLSTLALALTVMADKLMIGDFYDDEPRSAWFVSSFIGATLGLIATIFAWQIYGDSSILHGVILMMEAPNDVFAVAMILIGALVSLNLRLYFELFSQHEYTTTIAMAIAAAPILVFTLENTFITGEWNLASLASAVITTTALVLFEAFGTSRKNSGTSRTNWTLAAFIIVNAATLVLIGFLFHALELYNGYSGVKASLLLMPFYWVGFGFGITAIRYKEVRQFVKNTFSRMKFVYVVLFLEILGASFYFFEFLGLSELNVTLVTLIVGSHVILVWFLDLYLSSKAKEQKTGKIKVVFAEIDIANIEVLSRTQIVVQALCIIAVLIGISLWPGI
jgi:hypothetical protein